MRLRRTRAGERESGVGGGRAETLRGIAMMALNSMTGFARADGGDAMRWTWELRSVNGKGLDVRIRLPAGFERLERGGAGPVHGELGRGNVQVRSRRSPVPAPRR